MSFTVERGDALMLTGANGSGKTTLLRCLATALKPDHGRATWEGVDLWTDRAACRPKLSLYSHASALWEDLSGPENLRIWAQLGGYAPNIEARLDEVGLELRHEPVRTYSAGMRRRLALARSLLKEPELLLLDEPFAALDPDGRALVVDIANKRRASGTTLIIATHLPDEAAAVCDKRIHLEAGRAVAVP